MSCITTLMVWVSVYTDTKPNWSKVCKKSSPVALYGWRPVRQTKSKPSVPNQLLRIIWHKTSIPNQTGAGFAAGCSWPPMRKTFFSPAPSMVRKRGSSTRTSASRYHLLLKDVYSILNDNVQNVWILSKSYILHTRIRNLCIAPIPFYLLAVLLLCSCIYEERLC